MYHKDLKSIVADPEWQALRQSLLGTWRNDAANSVLRLRDYLGLVSDRNDPKFIRVYNYLTGTGFRSGWISHPAIDLFLGELRVLRHSDEWERRQRRIDYLTANLRRDQQ